MLPSLEENWVRRMSTVTNSAGCRPRQATHVEALPHIKGGRLRECRPRTLASVDYRPPAIWNRKPITLGLTVGQFLHDTC
jgi:hypothetical protein